MSIERIAIEKHLKTACY